MIRSGDITDRYSDDYDVTDPNDYEYLQASTLSSPNGNFGNSELEAELTPYDRPYRLENWPMEDLVMYCGGDYAKYENFRQRFMIGDAA